MLTTEQIENQLTTIYDRRRTLNRAAAALNVARAVAHLRDRFPTAAYAWVQVGPSAYLSGQYAADILRVHSATGSCLWHADDVDAKEIASPATDALVYAAEASKSSIPTYAERSHPVAGVTPDTGTGDDPALLVFADVDKAAERAKWATEVAVAVVPQINNGQPTLVLYPVPILETAGRELDFDQADAVKLGPPTVIGPDEFPTRPYTWTFFGHWEGGKLVIEYTEDGEVSDDRDDTGYWPEGLWAASAQGATIEEAEANARAEYEQPHAG
jgi:hypothetical protein